MTCKANRAMIVVGQNGKLVEHGYLSFSSYYNLWKRNFSHLKVSRPVEDICKYCFIFANRHRYLANHSTAASAPGVDPGVVEGGVESAATQTEEDRKLLLLEYAIHVRMARAQRALYQELVAQAVADATEKRSTPNEDTHSSWTTGRIWSCPSITRSSPDAPTTIAP